MKIHLICPKWPKLPNQREFNVPPHGATCFAAALPSNVEVAFCDENVEDFGTDQSADLVCLSVLLTCQLPRAFEIADDYRKHGKKVIMGGIATALHATECESHADSVFLGEAEGRMETVLGDFSRGELRKVYNYQYDFPDTALIRTARRSILNRRLYNYRGVQMVDLVHASRGCRLNCFPCPTPFLGGTRFRPRPLEAVLRELESIENNRLFFVDNSLSQDDDWAKNLFRAIAPLKKKWVSHPIKDDGVTLDLASKAGAWYVYQAIFDTSDYIRQRIKRLKDHGIGVAGTIVLGTDFHDEDSCKRLVDFLLTIDLDLAEFTILTPFPQTSIRNSLERERRILHNDWRKYTGGEVVFMPARMSPDALQRVYDYAWKAFYAECCQELRMAKLYLTVMERERHDGTYRPVRLTGNRSWRSLSQPSQDE